MRQRIAGLTFSIQRTGTVSVLVQIITTTSVLPTYIWKLQCKEKTYEHDFN